MSLHCRVLLSHVAPRLAPAERCALLTLCSSGPPAANLARATSIASYAGPAPAVKDLAIKLVKTIAPIAKKA